MTIQPKAPILVVDDDRMIRQVLTTALTGMGYCVTVAGNVAQCQSQVSETLPRLVLLDLNLPDGNGMTLLQQLRAENPNLPIILVTSETGSDSAIDALRLGAREYLTKPLDLAELRSAVERTLTHDASPVAGDVTAIRPMESVDPLIGRSREMQEVFKSVGRVASQNVSVLIRGESGTGKELVARAIRANSDRCDEQFLAVNCAALSSDLLESELFGHERGAFTGAESTHIGKFESCDQGTLFLDEVGDMHPAMQVKLLRVLQERTFSRVGGDTEIHTNARIISATNRDLDTMCERGEFRADLFHRLNGFTIDLPPLRKRVGDIRILLGHFLHRYNRKLNTKVESISPRAAFLLEHYHWPGNVREVESVLSQAMLNAQGATLAPNDFPSYVTTPPKRQEVLPPREEATTDDIHQPVGELETFIEMLMDSDAEDMHAQVQARMERYLLSRVLQQTNGNQSAAARRLGITRGSLRFKLKQLGMSIDSKVSVVGHPR